MKTLVAVVALALTAMAATPVNAQGDPNGVTLTLTSPGTLAYMGSGDIGFHLEVGCADLLANAGPAATIPVEVAVTDAQPWLNATAQTVKFNPADCVGGQGRVAFDGTIPLNVSAAAPGVSMHTVKAKATVGDAESGEPATTFTVAYKSEYALTPSVKFPLNVTNRTTAFAVTGVQASNAPSMIMLDDFSCTGGALVSGIGPTQYDNKAGTPDTKTYTVTFTAPDEDWEKVTCTLKVYGHYNFNNMGGPATDQKTFTWEFVNDGVPDAKGGGGGKKSPTPAGLFLAIGLLGLVAVLRRRQA